MPKVYPQSWKECFWHVVGYWTIIVSPPPSHPCPRRLFFLWQGRFYWLLLATFHQMVHIWSPENILKIIPPNSRNSYWAKTREDLRFFQRFIFLLREKIIGFSQPIKVRCARRLQILGVRRFKHFGGNRSITILIFYFPIFTF